VPPIRDYLILTPFVALAVPLAFQLQRLYRLRRGRTRVDDFFAVFVGSILAVVMSGGGILYYRTYYLSDALKQQGVFEVSQLLWGFFLVMNVLFTYTSREVVRDLLRRRWRAGIGLKHVLVVGVGDLGRMVADRILEHGELGFHLIGFADDRALSGDAIGYRGLPLLGPASDVAEICAREKVDEIYIALPIEEPRENAGRGRVLRASASASTCTSCRPAAVHRACGRDSRISTGLPIISVNDVPLRGMNSVLKRAVDIALSFTVLTLGAIPALISSLVIKRSSPGPVFYTQARMGLDGHAFTGLQVPIDAWTPRTRAGRPGRAKTIPALRRSAAGSGRHDIDELPQFWNVLRGDMSIVGRVRSGPSSSSSSSTASRSTC
jgi:hypothetical protein